MFIKNKESKRSNDIFKDAHKKINTEDYGSFHKTEHVDFWYMCFILIMIAGGALFIQTIQENHPFKNHAIIHYLLFVVLETYALLQGKYKTPEAHGFFASIKAIDIYTHLYGCFAVCLLTYVYFWLPLLETFILALIISYIIELFEMSIESLFSMIDRSSQMLNKSFIGYFSEMTTNTIQDLIMDTVGVLFGILYIIFIG